MSKKKKHEDDEEFDEEIDKAENTQFEEESDEENSGSEIVDGELIADDSDDIDIVLEISDDESEIQDSTVDEVILSKHKVQGKHSLKYDSIFKGKKEDKPEEDFDQTSLYFNEKFEVDKSSHFYVESQDNEFYVRQKNVKEKVYNVLLNHTNINFLNNRRKPSKSDFNHYYYLLKVNLEADAFTNIELFNELSVYFSDNLFNMFKLLDNKWRNLIINELQEHIGKNKNSKEVTNRNIYVGTELEFKQTDPLGTLRVYTGVVLETNYQDSTFSVDSYENIYEIHISSIVRILNNSKFKYNLNKLNNIDFL